MKKFYTDDTFVIRVPFYNEEYVTKYLYDLVTRDHEMIKTEIGM